MFRGCFSIKHDTTKLKTMHSASKLQILSFNPNSIEKNPKRERVLKYLKKKEADVILLSDTRLSKEAETLVKEEWSGQAYFASFTSQARGVAILISKDSPIKVCEDSIIRDKSGNMIVLNCEYENSTITLGCIYGPNNDNPDFYEEVLFPSVGRLQENSSFTIIGGDWNITLDQNLDTYGYNTVNNINAKEKVLEKISDYNLVDIFRELHPLDKRFTWRQFGGKKRSRLDFFLLSTTLTPFVEEAEIAAGVESDHSMPTIDIDFSKFQRGRGFFRFNNTLANDKEYVDLINETIRAVTALYAEDVYDEKFLKIMKPEEQQKLILTINPQLFLETLLLEIRGKTIGYCSWKKKRCQNDLNIALHKLEVAERASDLHSDDELLKENFEGAKMEVQRFLQKETEAARFRSRVKWQIEGEKPSKFFCTLEKYNAIQKYIPQLVTRDETGSEQILKNQKSIDNELYNYYQKLYKSQEDKVGNSRIENFLDSEAQCTPKLRKSQSEMLEGLITVKEATEYIKKCRSDASPGSSGFSGCFFKLFWRQLKGFVVNSLNYAYETGSLSVSQKLGVIILLPKPEKDKRYLANWRPISLLNQTYKILSGALAERLKQVLPDIINTDQKGFIRGRFMGECIRNTYDVMNYAKQNNRAGLLLLIDFEKAFDSISHSFIIKTLYHFGFGYSFIKWINVLLNGAVSCINHCGNVTDRFKVERSCRQGDPISPYLFILCVEILAWKIRQDDKVKGFNLGNYVQKLDFYADDLTAYLDGSESSLRRLIFILDEFHKISGLKINLSKCKAVWIGRYRFDQRTICAELKLAWSNKFKLLGIDFDSDLSEMDNNFRKKIKEIDRLYKNWLYRHLTPIGRVTVIKSLALSKLTHVVLVCPDINSVCLKELETLSFNFLWKGKPDRLQRKIVTLPYEKGGLNLLDLRDFWDSLKMSWSRRLLNTSSAWQKLLQLDLMEAGFQLKDLWYGGPLLLHRISEKVNNPFWSDMIRACARLLTNIPFAHPHLFYHVNIFDNELFAVKDEVLKRSEFPTLWDKQVCQVGDFFNTNVTPPQLMSITDLNSKFGLKLDFLSYHRLKSAIVSASKKLNHKTYNERLSDLSNPKLPPIQKLTCTQSKGCSIFYKTLRAVKIHGENTNKAEQKWHKELNTVYSVDYWDSIWKHIGNPLISNKNKWLQIQINHFTLPTNYTVNKYEQTQSPFCSFCHHDYHLEVLPALFWDCPKVNAFWALIANFLRNFYPHIILGKKEAIFGDASSKRDSVFNTILSLSRAFIWIQKFTSKKLEWNRYQNYLRVELNLVSTLLETRAAPSEVLHCWEPIFLYLNAR